MGHILLKPHLQIINVLAVAVKPVDSGIMAAVGQILVQAPEAADKSLRILCNRFREITALGGYRPDYADRALRVSIGLHIASPLIKLCEPRRQIGRKPFFCRHLLQSSGDLAERLRPAGGGVRHDRHVIPHVAIIFRQGDSCVDRCLTGRHRHVGGVRNQDRALHERSPGL